MHVSCSSSISVVRFRNFILVGDNVFGNFTDTEQCKFSVCFYYLVIDDTLNLVYFGHIYNFFVHIKYNILLFYITSTNEKLIEMVRCHIELYDLSELQYMDNVFKDCIKSSINMKYKKRCFIHFFIFKL